MAATDFSEASGTYLLDSKELVYSKFMAEILEIDLSKFAPIFNSYDIIGNIKEDLAKKLGISRSNLCDIERGRRFISSELAEKFAERLGESKEQFIRIALQDQLNRAGLKYFVNIKAA